MFYHSVLFKMANIVLIWSLYNWNFHIFQCVRKPYLHNDYFLCNLFKNNYVFGFSLHQVHNLGHVINEIAEVPLVVSDKTEGMKRTKEAVAFMKEIKAWDDVEKVCQICTACVLPVYSFGHIFRGRRVIPKKFGECYSESKYNML